MHDGPLWVANTLHICVLVLLFTQPLDTHIKPPCKSGRVSDPSSYNGRWNPDRRALDRLPLVFPQNWLFYVTFLLICVITSHNSINIPKGAQVIGLVALNWKFRTIGAQCSCVIVLFVIHARGEGSNPSSCDFRWHPCYVDITPSTPRFLSKVLIPCDFLSLHGTKTTYHCVCLWYLTRPYFMHERSPSSWYFMFHLGLRALLSLAWIFMSYLVDVATC
jgi:hypothetical protein